MDSNLNLQLISNSGMKTVYVQRATEDLHEDMDLLRAEFDAFVDGATDSPSGGLPGVASILRKGIGAVGEK